MERFIASFMLTLMVSVLGIPVAYLIGHRSAAEAARRQYQDDAERERIEQQQIVASLKAQLAESGSRSIPAAPLAPAPPEPQAAEPEPVRMAAVAPISAPEEIEETGEPQAPPILESTFDAAQLGARYEQVVQEFGREGEPMMTLEDGAGTVTTQYAWNACDAEGNPARIHLRFVDGRLIDKTLSE